MSSSLQVKRAFGMSKAQENLHNILHTISSAQPTSFTSSNHPPQYQVDRLMNSKKPTTFFGTKTNRVILDIDLNTSLVGQFSDEKKSLNIDLNQCLLGSFWDENGVVEDGTRKELDRKVELDIGFKSSLLGHDFWQNRDQPPPEVAEVDKMKRVIDIDLNLCINQPGESEENRALRKERVEIEKTTQGGSSSVITDIKEDLDIEENNLNSFLAAVELLKSNKEELTVSNNTTATTKRKHNSNTNVDSEKNMYSPVVKSNRGRSQVLPYKYRHPSVIMELPWKRGVKRSSPAPISSWSRKKPRSFR